MFKNLAAVLLLLCSSLCMAQIGPVTGGGASPVTTWNVVQSYSTGQAVIRNGVIYISLANNNVAHDPAGSPSQWSTNLGSGGSSLPTATSAGQVPTATGPGTTYTAQQPPAPGGSTLYLTNYLANPTVPAQARWDCTWSISSSPSTITCPSGTFTSSMTGWIAWATQLNPGGNAEVANNFACGGAGTNPTLTYVSSTTATINTACSVASGSSTNGGSAFVFGPDETSAVDTWITAVANACGTGVLPSGIVLTEHGGGGWNMTAAQNTNCGNATGVHTGGAVIAGQGITRSTIAIEPAFDFTTCTGGPTSNTCFGSAKTNASGILVGGYSFHDFSISGFGSTLDASTQTNWVEMLYGNYASNFAITKLGGTGVSHTVGIKLNGSFGQFWNLISDWSGAIPCWVTNGSPYAPNVMGGSSECVGGSGAAVSGIGSSYGVFISTNGWLVSHGSTFAGGDTNNIASDVAISGGTYEGYGDSACCTNTGTVMAIISFDSNGGTAIVDGFWGTITNMGNGSHFLSTASSGSPYISIRNTNVVIGGGTGQQCYDILSATAVFVDGGANNCSGSSSASTFSNTSGNTPLGLINPIGSILLSKQKLASTATNFTFSSIPQTYTSLHIVCAFQEGGGGSNLSMQLNGDTAAHYGYSYIYNNSGAPNSSTAQTGQTSSLVGIGTSGATIIEIPNYSGTTLTSTYYTGVSSGPGSNENGSTGGVWAGNAVTSVKIFDSAGASFSAGSTCNLYGLM